MRIRLCWVFLTCVMVLFLAACGRLQERRATRIANEQTDASSLPTPQQPTSAPLPTPADTAQETPAPVATNTPEMALVTPPTQATPVTQAGTSNAPCGNTLAIAPIAAGYGADGPYAVKTQAIPHPAWAGQEVTLFYPAGLENQATPVIFFGHGFAATNTLWYDGLMRHIASRGYTAVYSPYSIRGLDFDAKYEQMWEGFLAATQSSVQPLDLSRVGFSGHSFGAGAVPAMAYRGLVEQGWGREGAFLYIMAPYFMLDISNNQIAQLPGHINVLVQVYADDLTNDPRIAIDLYQALPIPTAQKDYVVVNSASLGTCSLQADHLTPGSAPRMVDGLDYYAVYRLFDALADYTFNRNEVGRQVALGHGSELQVNMGVWPETGAPLTPLTSQYNNPTATLPESAYQNPWSAPANSRADN